MPVCGRPIWWSSQECEKPRGIFAVQGQPVSVPAILKFRSNHIPACWLRICSKVAIKNAVSRLRSLFRPPCRLMHVNPLRSNLLKSGSCFVHLWSVLKFTLYLLQMVLSSIVSLSCTAFIFVLKTILDGAMVVDMTGLIPDNLSLYAILDVIVALTPVSTTMTKGFTVLESSLRKLVIVVQSLACKACRGKLDRRTVGYTPLQLQLI